MSKISTPIIPSRLEFAGNAEELDLPAICMFAAIGFFLGRDTYWEGLSTLPVGSAIETDEAGDVLSSKPYFEWHYTPRDISIEQATDEFTALFETILAEQVEGSRVILPLSGGLDSRTQAAGLESIGAEVSAYSYSFEEGHDETKYARKVAEVAGFDFESWRIGRGYLWERIDSLARINRCFSEFTHPRQMAVIENFDRLGEVFSLGHWGDVLFDDMGVPDELPETNLAEVVSKKLLKKGGFELASALWNEWELEGTFEEYLIDRIYSHLAEIRIENSANAKIRAFKSIHWAPKWTTVNLSVFENRKPITLPYYDNRMCEFICTVPEKHLAGRAIQIEYLKRSAPKLARIAWQAQRPFNLYSYHWNQSPYNVPLRAFNKLGRLMKGNAGIQRNWELQFLGEENDRNLKRHLFEEPHITDWISASLVRRFYDKFIKEDQVFYSHSVSMLLTLSVFSRLMRNNPPETVG